MRVYFVVATGALPGYGVRMREKELFLPKTRVKEDRLNRYHRAHDKWRAAKGLPDLSFAAFVRDALDARSDELLGKPKGR